MIIVATKVTITIVETLHEEDIAYVKMTTGKETAVEGSRAAARITCITPTPENPYGYLQFDLDHLTTYMNNQIQYYLTSGAMIGVSDMELQQQLESQKKTHEMLSWDGKTPGDNTPKEAEPVVPPNPPASAASRTL